jgi:acyl carrier protein
MSVNSRVVSVIRKTAEEQGFQLPELHDDLLLHETGLDSLAFTVLLSNLEDDFGFDPFTLSDEMAFPSTIGEFVRAYDRAHVRSLRQGPLGRNDRVA